MKRQFGTIMPSLVVNYGTKSLTSSFGKDDSADSVLQIVDAFFGVF